MPTLPIQMFPLLFIADTPDWDFIVKVIFTTFGVLMSIIAYLFKRRIEAYDKHLEECRERAVAQGRMDERIKNVEKNTNWVGNCIVSIGTKIGAELPIRPE